MQDGLWDIPIKSNYIMPQTHPSLCKSRINHVSSPLYTQKKKRKKKTCNHTPTTTTHEPIANQELQNEIHKIIN